ncbi:MAG: hypothetical protein IJP10_00755 [Clostridia bacterium]|nr:hypothetical protein [Clostridia bacterium]
MELALIHCDGGFRDIKVLDCFEQFDCTVGDSENDNDWMLEFAAEEWARNPVNPGDHVYIDNTEWGGPAERVRHSSDDGKVRVYGTNWRGLLGRRGVCPAAGQTHYKVDSCEANELMAQLIGNWRNSLFHVSDENSGIVCSGSIRYKPFDRAMETLLGDKAGIRLFCSGGRVELSAVRVNDISELMELSDEYDAGVISQRRRGEYNHIIALGRGELLERDVVEMWMLDDGTITEDSSLDIPSDNELSTYIYDYSAVESLAELRAAAKKKLAGFSFGETMEITLSGIDTQLELTDRISVRDSVTGMVSRLRVQEKRLRIDKDSVTVTHILK